jgi:nucleotide-binding universal stress UspA family protein
MAVSHMKVLVAYDGSECADAAVDDLRRAGLHGDVEAVVLSVADVFPNLPPEMFDPPDAAAKGRQELSPSLKRVRTLAAQAMKEARLTAARGAGRVKGVFPGWNVRTVAVGDSPYRAIVREAESWRPDLLVVGSQGRSGVGRVLLGSVSQLVLQHAPCSVRIARCPEDVTRLADEPPRLVVGIDGSPDAAAAVSAVCDRTWPAGTRAQVVTAVDVRMSMALAGLGPPVGAWAVDPGKSPDERAWARQAVEAAAKELQSAGLDATPLVEQGDPKRVVPELAAKWPADCIFVGAKGHSRMQQFLIGSVSAAIAARARCSVEVVRQG